jgi:hypothetical protein
MNTKQLLNKLLEINHNYLPSSLNDIDKLYFDNSFEINKKVSLLKLKTNKYKGERKTDVDTYQFVKFVSNNLPSFKQFKDDDNLEYLIKNNNLLFLELLIYSIYKPLTLATFVKRINSYIRLLYIYFDMKNDMISHYLNIIYHIQIKLLEENEEQSLSEIEKKTFIDFNLVLNLREALEQIFNESKSYKDNQDLLLLSCYSLIPPNRAEIIDLIFINDFKDNDLVNDFIYVNNNDVKFILNKEKKKHKSITINIEGHLNFLIKQSFELFPRAYLFTDYTDVMKPVTYNQVYKRFRSLFKDTGIRVSINSLRSSYLSYYNTKGMSIKDKKVIASAMRTSKGMIDGNYIKIDKDYI